MNFPYHKTSTGRQVCVELYLVPVAEMFHIEIGSGMNKERCHVDTMHLVIEFRTVEEVSFLLSNFPLQRK